MHADNIFYVNKRFSKQSMWLCLNIDDAHNHTVHTREISLFLLFSSVCPFVSLSHLFRVLAKSIVSFDMRLNCARHRLFFRSMSQCAEWWGRSEMWILFAKNMDMKTLFHLSILIVSSSFLPFYSLLLHKFFFPLYGVYVFVLDTRYPLQASTINF